jgi:hypothetical protein
MAIKGRVIEASNPSTNNGSLPAKLIQGQQRDRERPQDLADELHAVAR